MKVKDLIAILQEYPEDCEIVMVDADTGWHIPKIYHGIDKEQTLVMLWGEYPDMINAGISNW